LIEVVLLFVGTKGAKIYDYGSPDRGRWRQSSLRVEQGVLLLFSFAPPEVSNM
jgi:hypothetical protein